MPQVTGRIGTLGPVADAAALPPPARIEAARAEGRPAPSPRRAPALLDVGAARSAIDRSIVADLGLGPAGEADDGRTYPVTIAIGPGAGRSLVRTVEAVAADLGPRGVGIVVGRDILEQCVLVCHGPKAEFRLTFKARPGSRAADAARDPSTSSPGGGA